MSQEDGTSGNLEDIESRQEAFGSNQPVKEDFRRKSCMELFCEVFMSSCCLHLLLVFGSVLLFFGSINPGTRGYHEGLGMLIVIALLYLASFGFEYRR